MPDPDTHYTTVTDPNGIVLVQALEPSPMFDRTISIVLTDDLIQQMRQGKTLVAYYRGMSAQIHYLGRTTDIEPAG